MKTFDGMSVHCWMLFIKNSFQVNGSPGVILNHEQMHYDIMHSANHENKQFKAQRAEFVSTNLKLNELTCIKPLW